MNDKERHQSIMPGTAHLTWARNKLQIKDTIHDKEVWPWIFKTWIKAREKVND